MVQFIFTSTQTAHYYRPVCLSNQTFPCKTEFFHLGLEIKRQAYCNDFLRFCFCLNNFPFALSLQKQIIVDPLAFSEERFRPSLEERLESIISGAALMADSSCTRDDRRERIVAECNSVRQALQDLLSEYMGNVSVISFLLPFILVCIHNTAHNVDMKTFNFLYVLKKYIKNQTQVHFLSQ